MTDLITRAGEVLAYEPKNPAQMEMLITEVTDLLEQMPGKLLELNEVRYQAERAWSRKRNTALAHHALTNPVTVARALADVDALGELKELHDTKAAWHYADDTRKALQSKLFAALNINKSVQAAYGAWGARR